MRWFVLGFSAPVAHAPPGSAHAQPPGPGFPLHAPSVNTVAGWSGTGASIADAAVRNHEVGGCMGSDPPIPRTPMSEPSIHDAYVTQLPDTDPEETREWLES